MNPFDFQFGETIFKKRKDLDEFVMKLDFKNLPYDQRMVLFDFKNVFEYYRRNNPKDEKYTAEEHTQNSFDENDDKTNNQRNTSTIHKAGQHIHTVSVGAQPMGF